MLVALLLVHTAAANPIYPGVIHEALDASEYPLCTVCHATLDGGFGTVTKADMKGDRGFTWWDVEIAGNGPYAGHTYKVFVKNENIVAWLDGVPDAMSPDTIQNLDPKTGDAHNGGQLGGYKIGAEIAMIGYETSPLWRTHVCNPLRKREARNGTLVLSRLVI